MPKVKLGLPSVVLLTKEGKETVKFLAILDHGPDTPLYSSFSSLSFVKSPVPTVQTLLASQGQSNPVRPSPTKSRHPSPRTSKFEGPTCISPNSFRHSPNNA